MTDYSTLPFDELRSLHQEIGALLAQKRHEALEDLRQKASILGFTVDDLAPRKPRGRRPSRKRQDDDGP